MKNQEKDGLNGSVHKMPFVREQDKQSVLNQLESRKGETLTARGPL
jgi:hypothetical protein